MTDFEALPPRLQDLGRRLVAAADEMHATSPQRSRWWRRPPRGVVVGIAVTALAIPAAALAATQLISPNQVAASLPQGSLVLMGTDPSCTVVQAGVEYHCVLANPPNTGAAPRTTTTAATTTSSGGEGVAGWHPPVVAAGTAPDGKVMEISQPSLAAAKREIAAARLTHVMIAQTSKGQSLTGDPKNHAIIVSSNTKPPPRDWKGAIELTVDSASKRVTGGCRGLNISGTQWECYVGEAAVKQRMIAQRLLGQYAPDPTVG
jgi:hypothetical protein